MFINWAKTKTLIENTATSTRHQFKNGCRVSADWIPFLEGKLISIIEEEIKKHPSKGKTIFPPVRPGDGK